MYLKKIIFVTNYFGNGGAATVMKSIINHLNKAEYSVILISFLDDQNKYDVPENVTYISLTNKMRLGRFEKWKCILKLREILKKEQSATVISFEYFINMRTILAHLFLKSKLVVSERNDPSRSGNDKRLIRNVLYRFASILVCQTNDAKNYFPSVIQIKTIVIPNAIRSDLPEPYVGIRKKKIVTFCRVEKQKNLPMMIDAFQIFHEKYPDYQLEIYGDGSEKKNVIQYTIDSKLDQYVMFYDFKKNLHRGILDYSMFVSTSDFEGISNSMLEAMAIGLPTICTDCPCGGASMAIEDGVNGFLSPVGDGKSFAEKMIYLVSHPDLMEKFSKNYYMVKEKFDSEKIYNEWEKLMK